MSQQKWILAAALVLATTAAGVAQDAAGSGQTAGAGQSSELKNDKDKFSYALGMNFGVGFKKQGLDVDPAIFAKAFADAYAGGKTALTDQEMQGLLQAKAQEIRQKQASEQAEKSAQAQKDGDKFLADNKAKDGVVTLPSGLQYKILKAGAGEKPTLEDTVTCNYKGTLINGEEFDASEKHGGPASFPVKGVIAGWTEALQLMPVGSKWQLFVPANLAYGQQGPPGIGANQTLIFEVELVSIKKPGAQGGAAGSK